MPVMLDYYIQGDKGTGTRVLPSLRLEPIASSDSESGGSQAVDTVAAAASISSSLATSQPVVRVKICIDTDLAFEKADLLQQLQRVGFLDRHFHLLDRADTKSTLIFASVSTASWSTMPRGHAAIRFLGFEMDNELAVDSNAAA